MGVTGGAVAAAVALVLADLEGVVGRVSFDTAPDFVDLATAGEASSLLSSGNERNLKSS